MYYAYKIIDFALCLLSLLFLTFIAVMLLVWVTARTFSQ